MDGFKILTEFRFDVGNALVSSEKLQGAVDDVAKAADQANFAFEKFSTGLVGQFNLMNFGLMGILKTSLDVTNQFQQSTKDFAVMMGTNMNYLQGPIQSFNDKLLASRTLMDEIGARSARLGISPTATIKATQSIAASLIPQGLAGTNFRNAQNLAVAGVQAGKPMGMDGAQIGREIASLVSGKDVGGSLMTALIGSSKTFAKFKGNIEEFTNLKGAERVKMLTQGLKEMKDAMGATGNELVTFSDVTDKLKDIVFGLGSVLRPIGDVIFPIIMHIVKEFTDRVQEFAPRIGKEIGSMLQDIAGNPAETIKNVMALRHVGSDFSMAKDILAVASLLDGLFFVLKKFGILKGGLGKLIVTLAGDAIMSGLKGGFGFLKGLASLEGLMKIGSFIMGLAKALEFGLMLLRVVFVELIFPLAFLVSLFQAIHKALAIVQFEKTMAMLRNLPAVVEGIHKIQTAIMKIAAPFLDFIDVMSKLFAEMIMAVTGAENMVEWIQMIADGLDMLGDGIIIFMTGLHGVVAGIIQLVGDLMNMRFQGIGGRVKDAMNDSMDDYLGKHMKKIDDGKNVSNQITNIGKVEIRNDFKDNVEPDRIAFTMKDQLLKAAQNRTQSRGRSLQTSFAR
jgi:hypothetical protein